MTAEKVREYRRKNPQATRENTVRNAAVAMAARVVASRHPYEWQREYIAECERRGVDPFPPRGRPKAIFPRERLEQENDG